jgi:hypothetical protein
LNHQGRQDHQGVPGELDALARQIVDAGLKVHRALGPGLLESAYELCLVYELGLLKFSGLRFGFLMNFNTPLFKDGVRRIAL